MEGSESKSRGPRVVFAATDLSAPADAALRAAHERALHAGAKLVVCHVVPSLVRVNALFPERSAEQASAQVELAERVFEALVERTAAVTGRDPSEFAALVDDGTPYARISELAEEHGAELIVIGDRGATGLTRMLLGSVAERVVRYAHCPVLIARSAVKGGKILVASDLSDPSLPAVSAAAAEARRTGAELTALHCVEPVAVVIGSEYGMSLAPTAGPGPTKLARERAQVRLEQALRENECRGEIQIVEGVPAAAILAVAEELQADLIVLGTRGRTGLKRVLLGSVAEAVARHAAASVLVVRLSDGGSHPIEAR